MIETTKLHCQSTFKLQISGLVFTIKDESSEYLPKKAVRRVKQKNKRRRVSTKTPQAKVAKKVEILSRKKIKKKFFYEISYNGVVSPFLMPKEINMTSWREIKDRFNRKCSKADFAADHTTDIREEEI